MQKLKKVYDVKKQLIVSDINDLGIILREHSNIEIINTNSDNTLYLESNCGMDSIENELEKGIKKLLWSDDLNILRNMIFNTLPLSNNSCIVRI